MNYYPFHLGDYAAHTGHMEPMEDLAYRRLLDVYYMREGALPVDVQQTAKLVRMRSMAADVESVLTEFFTLTEAGWVHSRCDAEIAKMQDKQEKARASGIASANARKAYVERQAKTKPADVEIKPTDVERTLAESTTDVQLPTPTPTPTPTPIKDKRGSAALATPDGVSPSVWSDFLKLRKAKNAPMTQTALDGIQREADKAGVTLENALATCCEAGWQGFNAEWYAARQQSASTAKSTEPGWRKDARERMQAVVPSIAEKSPAAMPAHQFFEMEAKNVTALRVR